MIERDESVGGQTMRCDECGDLLDGDFNIDNFQGMIEFAKEHGWKIKPDGEGGWDHFIKTSLKNFVEQGKGEPYNDKYPYSE